jgi:hypothetical protein
MSSVTTDDRPTPLAFHAGASLVAALEARTQEAVTTLVDIALNTELTIDPDEIWASTTTMLEFLAANGQQPLDQEDMRRIFFLNMGERHNLGGGAAAQWVVERTK